jgi:hypothetical protein
VRPSEELTLCAGSPGCCRGDDPWLTKEGFRDRCFRAAPPRLAAVVNERPAAAPPSPHIGIWGIPICLRQSGLARVFVRHTSTSRPQGAQSTDRGTVSNTNGFAVGSSCSSPSLAPRPHLCAHPFQPRRKELRTWLRLPPPPKRVWVSSSDDAYLSLLIFE